MQVIQGRLVYCTSTVLCCAVLCCTVITVCLNLTSGTRKSCSHIYQRPSKPVPPRKQPFLPNAARVCVLPWTLNRESLCLAFASPTTQYGYSTAGGVTRVSVRRLKEAVHGTRYTHGIQYCTAYPGRPSALTLSCTSTQLRTPAVVWLVLRWSFPRPPALSTSRHLPERIFCQLRMLYTSFTPAYSTVSYLAHPCHLAVLLPLPLPLLLPPLLVLAGTAPGTAIATGTGTATATTTATATANPSRSSPPTHPHSRCA